MDESTNDNLKTYVADRGASAIDLDQLLAELKRLVSHPLSTRQVGTYVHLPRVPSVQAVLPDGAGPTRTVRAIVEILSRSIQNLEGQSVHIPGIKPLHLDTTVIREVVGSLLGITKQGRMDSSPAPERRAKAAEAMGFDLGALGGDKGFRQRCEPVLLQALAGELVAGQKIPAWFVDRVSYHYRYNAERVLSSTNYKYDVTSQRDGTDFFINHTAPINLGTFELTSSKNCEVVEHKQLSSRTLELHLQLREGAAGTQTHFSYQLKPTDPHISEDKPPVLATIGQLEVASVQYVVDFETHPEMVWRFDNVPPPMEGDPQLEEPESDDDPRLIERPYDTVTRTFRSLDVRYFYGIAWKW